jgi:RNA polymerase sigma factor (sigma-70 family)
MLYSQTTDPNLIESAKDWRDDDGWQRFYTRYAPGIRAHALGSGLSEAEAEDVVQETMVKVARYLPRFEYKRTFCRFRTWLNQIVNQRIFEALHLRRKHVYSAERLEELSAKMHAEDVVTSDAVAQAEAERSLLEACMARVRDQAQPKHWQIFEANSLHGLSADKVAALHGTTSANVWVIRHRMVRLLRREWHLLLEAPFSPGDLI